MGTMIDRRVRQSVCAICRKTVGVGSGTVLAYGAGGRVHTKECLQKAQKATLSRPTARGRLAHPACERSAELR